MSNQSYRVYMLSRAVSPLTHMSGTAGNEAIIMREYVRSGVSGAWVPVLSGNALRHRIVRAPGMTWLIERYGLIGKLTLRQLNFLLHGGNLTDKGGRESMQAIQQCRQLWPLLGLIGGALPGQIVRGSLQVDRGTLVCRENASRLSAFVPSGVDIPEGLPAAEQYVTGYQYTRGDTTNSAPHLTMERELDPDTGLMIFGGQSVAPGATFAHGFRLDSVSRAELGALLLSLSLWRDQGGTIGGQASRGHGRLDAEIMVDPAIDAEEVIAEYVQAVDDHKDHAIQWLCDMFGVLHPDKRLEPTNEAN